jgi:hypothetical protein
LLSQDARAPPLLKKRVSIYESMITNLSGTKQKNQAAFHAVLKKGRGFNGSKPPPFPLKD